MTPSEPEPEPGSGPRSAAPDPGPEEPRYELPPSVGKLAVWLLVFMVAALAVVLGGVYFT
jgi:hypothetical protein